MVHSSITAAPEMVAIVSEGDMASIDAFNSTNVGPAPWSAPAHEAIAHWAYALYLARGANHGKDLDDWLQAERALLRALSAAEQAD
jgi:hypothetical protein